MANLASFTHGKGEYWFNSPDSTITCVMSDGRTQCQLPKPYLTPHGDDGMQCAGGPTWAGYAILIDSGSAQYGFCGHGEPTEVEQDRSGGGSGGKALANGQRLSAFGVTCSTAGDTVTCMQGKAGFTVDSQHYLILPRDAKGPAGRDMRGRHQAIACDSGYILQVASQTNDALLKTRADEIFGLNQIPGGIKWTRTGDGCHLYQGTGEVMYTGPYPDEYAGCADRRASPPDAFLRPTDPGDSHAFITCLCAPSDFQVQAVKSGARNSVMVGELQHILEAGLKKNIRSIDTDPSLWGTYDADTAAAVADFKASVGDSTAGTVMTVDDWSLLAAQVC